MPTNTRINLKSVDWINSLVDVILPHQNRGKFASHPSGWSLPRRNVKLIGKCIDHLSIRHQISSFSLTSICYSCFMYFLCSDNDFDCRDGLLCAEKHFAEILAFGYADKRKAYCLPPYSTGGANGGNQGPVERLEVCYNPKKLTQQKKNSTKLLRA